MVRTVEDAALALNAIAGHDPLDATTSRAPVPDYTSALSGDVRGLRIGVVKEYFEAALDPQVETATRKAMDTLEELGAKVSEISFPMYEESQAISGTILMAEAAAYHRELLARDGGLLYPPVRLRLEAGLFISAADYIRAQQARTRFNRAAVQLLDEVNLLAGPTEPVTAPTLFVDQCGRRRPDPGHYGSSHPIHSTLQHNGLSGYFRSLRLLRGRAAHRTAAGGPALRRANGVESRPRLRAGHRMERPQTSHLVGIGHPGPRPSSPDKSAGPA